MFEKAFIKKIFGEADELTMGKYNQRVGLMFSMPKPETKRITKILEKEGLVTMDFRGRGGMHIKKNKV